MESHREKRVMRDGVLLPGVLFFFNTKKMGWGEYSCLALTSSSVLGITDIIPE